MFVPETAEVLYLARPLNMIKALLNYPPGVFYAWGVLDQIYVH